MGATKYIRNGSTITSVEKDGEGNPVEIMQHESLNKAKKKSRSIQIAEDGAIGRGSVMLA